MKEVEEEKKSDENKENAEKPQSKQDVSKMAKEFIEAQNRTIVEMQRKQEVLMERLGIDLEGEPPFSKKRKRDVYEGAYGSDKDYRDYDPDRHIASGSRHDRDYGPERRNARRDDRDYDPERRSARRDNRDYDPERRSASRLREIHRQNEREDVPPGRSAQKQAEDDRRGHRTRSPRVEHPSNHDTRDKPREDNTRDKPREDYTRDKPRMVNKVYSPMADAYVDIGDYDDEDLVSLHPQDDLYGDYETDNPLGRREYDEDHDYGHDNRDRDELPDDDEQEQIMTAKYQSMIDLVQEELGDPVSEPLAKVCERSWNQARLDAEKKKEFLKDIKIPRNMEFMKTPKLNSEVYLRLRNNAKQGDEASAKRARDVTKAVIPMMRGLDKVTAAQKALKDKDYSKVAERLKDIDQLIQKSYGILNYFVTDNTRRRKFQACSSLGGCDGSQNVKEDKIDVDNLFGEQAMQKLKPILKKIPLQLSKNAKGSSNAPRGQFQGGYRNFRGDRNGYSQQRQQQQRQNYQQQQRQGSSSRSNNNRGNGRPRRGNNR